MFEISKRDICLWLALVVMGYLLTGREFLLSLNTLNAYEGFILYYVILYGSIFTLSKLDLVKFKANVSNIRGTTGLLLFMFGLFAIVNWESPYIQYVTTGSFQGASAVFFQTEDGILWNLTTQFLGITNVEVARIVSFMVLAPLISLLGLSLIEGKVKVRL